MKHLAIVGGLMIAMTRGKISRNNEQVNFHVTSRTMVKESEGERKQVEY